MPGVKLLCSPRLTLGENMQLLHLVMASEVRRSSAQLVLNLSL